MGNKNYTKYSENSNNKVDIQEIPTTPGTTPEMVNNVEDLAVNLADQTGADVTVDVTINEIPTTPETTPEVQNYSKKDEDNYGAIAPAVVANCSKLNVRKEASKDSDVVRVVVKGDELVVDLDASTEDFYKVEVAGMEGYCVKDFIEIK